MRNQCVFFDFSEGDGGNVVADTRRITEEKPFHAVPGIGLFRNTERRKAA